MTVWASMGQGYKLGWLTSLSSDSLDQLDGFPMAASVSCSRVLKDHAVTVSERKKCERRAKMTRNRLRICERGAHGV